MHPHRRPSVAAPNVCVFVGRLEAGEKVKISGFGNFVVRQKNERKGRNPQTGEEIRLPARRVLTFKPSLVLKNILNEETAGEEDGG